MFTEINDTENLVLWDTHNIRINRKGLGAEIVVYKTKLDNANVSVRYAPAPYRCTLHLENGDEVSVHLGDECDWGNIQPCAPDDCEDWENSIGWGNDEDGHVKIVRVTDDAGWEIPLDEFRRDVEDFVIYFEC